MLAFSHRLLGFPACPASTLRHFSLVMAIGVAAAAFCFNTALIAGRGLSTGQQVEGKEKDVFAIIRELADRACCRRPPAAHRRRSAEQG